LRQFEKWALAYRKSKERGRIYDAGDEAPKREKVAGELEECVKRSLLTGRLLKGVMENLSKKEAGGRGRSPEGEKEEVVEAKKEIFYQAEEGKKKDGQRKWG